MTWRDAVVIQSMITWMSRGNVHLLESVSSEISMQAIIHFFKINVNSHVPFSTLFPSHSMKDLLHKHYIIDDLSAWNKTRLCIENDPWQNRFKSIHNHLSDNFISNIGKSNWPKLRSQFRWWTLGMMVIKVSLRLFGNPLPSKTFSTKLYTIFAIKSQFFEKIGVGNYPVSVPWEVSYERPPYQCQS